jgi:hypothetical protein
MWCIVRAELLTNALTGSQTMQSFFRCTLASSQKYQLSTNHGIQATTRHLISASILSILKGYKHIYHSFQHETKTQAIT